MLDIQHLLSEVFASPYVSAHSSLFTFTAWILCSFMCQPNSWKALHTLALILFQVSFERQSSRIWGKEAQLSRHPICYVRAQWFSHTCLITCISKQWCFPSSHRVCSYVTYVVTAKLVWSQQGHMETKGNQPQCTGPALRWQDDATVKARP